MLKKWMGLYDLEKDMDMDTLTRIAALALLFVLSGLWGWAYESVFYWINSGCGVWYWRGMFGPWIDIYGFGGLLIYFTTRRLRSSPWKVALVSGIGAGVLELVMGAGLFFFAGGFRGWNYNTEILNFGNICGFICLRSVLVFALSGLMLVYAVRPATLWLAARMPKGLFRAVSLALAALFLADFLYTDILQTRIPGTVGPKELYHTRFGFQLMEFTQGLLNG